MTSRQNLGGQVFGEWWHRLEGTDRIRCDLCPRYCTLRDGDRGFCFVRQNLAGQMVLTTYGRSTGFCVDPVEKKPLYHFLPGSSVLSFGTAGCNLGCQFCQNWSISKSRKIEKLSELASPEQIADMAVKLGCRSVAFTYNDPVIWAEYAIDTAEACHKRGIKTIAVTAGYITPEARPEFYSVMDAANVDLKGFTERFYERLTLGHLEPVLNTLKWLKEYGKVWFEITNLMIPGENDSEQEVEDMCAWLADNVGFAVPVHFTAFHPSYRVMDKPVTPAATLARARDQALKAGLKYVYVGNVLDRKRESTYCPACGQCLIERAGYRFGAYWLRDNACAYCGEIIAGVFEKSKEDWGARSIRQAPGIMAAPLGWQHEGTAEAS